MAPDVRFNVRRRGFVCRESRRSYRGITKLIAALCVRRSTLHHPRAPRAKARARKSVYGLAGGCRVDSAITRAVRAGRERDAACPEVGLFFAELRRHRLEAVEAQYVVWCDDSGIATSIDVVARRQSDGGVVVLEVKCGYDGSWDVAHGGLRGPGRALQNSPRVLAFVQACVGADLLASVADEPPKDVAVVRILRSGASLEFVPQSVLRRMDGVCKYLRRAGGAADSGGGAPAASGG